MKSVFKNPRLKAQQSRNAFDRGAKKVFHAPFGMILPCFVAKVSPDDYIELSAENQCICEPLARPAFMRLKEHIDYFFVPYSQLYTPFENLVTAQDNYFSDIIADRQSYNTPNSVPMFNASWLKVNLSQLKNQKDIHGFNKLYGALRLLDLLGYGNYYRDVARISGQVGEDYFIDNLHLPNMNMFNLLAYQKIYYDFFRNPKYEQNNPSAYNIDKLSSNTVLTTTSAQDYSSIFDIHYRWMKKDYFMSVQPSIIPVSSNIGYSGLSTDFFRDSANFAVPGIIQPGSGLNVGVDAQGISDSIKTPTNSSSAQNTNLYANMNSVAAIRLNFAIDRISRRQREAGAQFDKQMLAQFGITPIDERHGKCVFIGGQTNRLYASDVTNQSETGESGLGSLGGQINVYSPNRRTFKYHAKEHGIVMGIYSTSLENDYPSFSISRDNTAQGRFDWFNPGFDRLGLQPIFRHELSFISDQSIDLGEEHPEPDPHDIAVLADQKKILGYVRRYMEYKTNVDQIHGLFASSLLSPEDSAWTTRFKMTEFDNQVQKVLAPLDRTCMQFNPMTFDDVSQVDYDGTWRTDHFKLNHFTHCRVISNMDVIGEDF